MKALPWLVSFFCFFVWETFPLFGQSPHPPVGLLGLPLGTFAVIEGEGIQSGKLFGRNNFEMRIVNGKKLNPFIQIAVGMQASPARKGIEPGKSYVLHGYERGGWVGAPLLPRGEEWEAQTGPGNFQFATQFFITSIEKVDGVTAADARLLDSGYILPESKPELFSDPKPFVGALGLPLGTFAIIEGRPPKLPLLLENAFEVDTVNGKHLVNPRLISIEGMPNNGIPPKGNKRFIVHGFETGSWENAPDLPRSETLSDQRSQQPFQFYHQFMVTSPIQSVGNPSRVEDN